MLLEGGREEGEGERVLHMCQGVDRGAPPAMCAARAHRTEKRREEKREIPNSTGCPTRSEEEKADLYIS